MAGNRFVRLDAFRGFLAIGVVAFHSNLSPLFAWYWISMDFFFVMSGFLITKTMLDLKSKGKGPLDFFVYRATRLLPAFLVTLFSVETFIYILNQGLFSEDWAGKIDSGFSIFYALMIQNLDLLFGDEVFPRGIGLIHFWSLILEEHYYLFAGIGFFVFYKPNTQKLSYLVWLTAVSLACSAIFRYFGGHWWTLLGRIDGFAIGSLLGLITFSDVLRVQISPVGKYTLKIAVVFAFFWIAGSALLSYQQNYQEYSYYKNRWLDIPFASILAAYVIYAIYKRDLAKSVVKRPLKIFAFIGLISFELYVIHIPIIAITTKVFAGLLNFRPASEFSALDPFGYVLFVVVLVTSLPLALLMHKILTKPSLRSRPKLVALLTKTAF